MSTYGGKFCFHTGMTGIQESYVDFSHNSAGMQNGCNAVEEKLDADISVFAIYHGHRLSILAGIILPDKMPFSSQASVPPGKFPGKERSEKMKQKYGFGLDARSIPGHDKINTTHMNLDDETMAGFKVRGKKPYPFNISLNFFRFL